MHQRPRNLRVHSSWLILKCSEYVQIHTTCPTRTRMAPVLKTELPNYSRKNWARAYLSPGSQTRQVLCDKHSHSTSATSSWACPKAMTSFRLQILITTPR